MVSDWPCLPGHRPRCLFLKTQRSLEAFRSRPAGHAYRYGPHESQYRQNCRLCRSRQNLPHCGEISAFCTAPTTRDPASRHTGLNGVSSAFSEYHRQHVSQQRCTPRQTHARARRRAFLRTTDFLKIPARTTGAMADRYTGTTAAIPADGEEARYHDAM